MENTDSVEQRSADAKYCLPKTPAIPTDWPLKGKYLTDAPQFETELLAKFETIRRMIKLYRPLNEYAT